MRPPPPQTPPRGSTGTSVPGSYASTLPGSTQSMMMMSPVPHERRGKEMHPGVTRETATFCCLFFVYLSVVPFLFVFFYHLFPTSVLAIMFLCALGSFIPLAFNRGDSVVKEPVGPLLSASMLACTTLVFVGSMHLYYAHVHPMRVLLLARTYDGVYPDLPAAGFVDAAYLNFVGDTALDKSKALGLKTLDAGHLTFCVAPVANRPFTNSSTQMWAVGVNCCGDNPTGRFDCDDAGKAGVKSAYVLQEPTDVLFGVFGKYVAPPEMRRDLFLQGVKKAEHMNNVVSAKEPLLLRWTSQTKEEIISEKTVNIVVACLLNVVFSLVLSLLLTRIVQRFGQLRAEHHGHSEEHEQLSARSRFEEFYQTTVNETFENVSTALAHPQLRPPLSKSDTFTMGIALPFVAFMLCVILTTYSACWTHGHLIYWPFLSILGVTILALKATPQRHMQGLFLLIVTLAGLHIGNVNYKANMFQSCSVDDGQSYVKVPADGESEQFRDAGTLTFDDKAYLSQNYSVGFKFQDVTYCVAPILRRSNNCEGSSPAPAAAPPAAPATAPVSFLQRMSRMQMPLEPDDEAEPEIPVLEKSAVSAVQCTAVGPTNVEFWAIGTDCCGARKDFRCDGGKDASAHSAVLVRATGNEVPGGEREKFLNAIAQSLAAYQLPAPNSPLLIRWGKDTKALQNDWNMKAFGMILLSAMIGGLAIVASGLGSFFLHKRQRDLEQQAAQRKRDEKERMETLNKHPSFFSTFDGFFGGNHAAPQRRDDSRQQLTV